METIMSSDVIVAYSICARKAFLLLFTAEKGESVEYIDILKQKATSQKRIYETLEKISDKGVRIRGLDDLKQRGDLLSDASFEYKNLQASCDILRKTNNDDYEPSIFIGTYRIHKYDKLRLIYVAHILKEIRIPHTKNGVILDVGGKKHSIGLKTNTKGFLKIILSLQDWQKEPPPECPPVFLHKNCIYCQFQKLCKEKAKQDDNLSLLSGISARAIHGYSKKGIFTVNQLSYFFKPRRLKKQAKKQHKAHKPELQALAIRNNKVYVQELPKFSRNTTEFFIDFEGIPDQSFYYLLGILVLVVSQSLIEG